MPHRRIRRNISVVLVVQQQHIRGIHRFTRNLDSHHRLRITTPRTRPVGTVPPRIQPSRDNVRGTGIVEFHRSNQPYFDRGDFSPPPAGIKQGSRNANREDSASRQRKKRTTNILEVADPSELSTEHDGGDRISDTAADVVPRTVHCDSLPISSHASSAGLVVSSLENDNLSGDPITSLSEQYTGSVGK